MRCIMFNPFFSLVLPIPSAGYIQQYAYKVDIFEAIRTGHYSDVKDAIESEQVNINYTNARGQTLLTAAICYRQVEIAKHLISLGADLETPDPSGKSTRSYIKGYGLQELYDTHAVVASVQRDISHSAAHQDEHQVEVVGVDSCCICS